jgi:hypothetical protein
LEQKLDPQAIAAENDAIAALLNGLRFYSLLEETH